MAKILRYTRSQSWIQLHSRISSWRTTLEVDKTGPGVDEDENCQQKSNQPRGSDQSHDWRLWKNGDVKRKGSRSYICPKHLRLCLLRQTCWGHQTRTTHLELDAVNTVPILRNPPPRSSDTIPLWNAVLILKRTENKNLKKKGRITYTNRLGLLYRHCGRAGQESERLPWCKVGRAYGRRACADKPRF